VTACGSCNVELKEDFDRAVSMTQATEPLTRAATMYFTYIVAVANGVTSPTAPVVRRAEEALAVAKQSGENVTLAQGRNTSASFWCV
jgi:hypothetical protein